MKKLIIEVITICAFILPVNIFAYELTCDNSEFTYNDNFFCHINGDMLNYDKLDGTITTSSDITCSVSSVASGLTDNSTDSQHFSLVGQASDTNLVNLNCTVVNNVSESTNTQISVDDFTYHILNSGVDESREILKSDYLHLNPHVEEVVTDTKPRDLSNPDIRLKSLSIPELNFTFSQFISTYSVEVLYDVEKINIDYALNDLSSQVRIDGSTDLEVGENTIDIYITSADQTRTNCYTLTINRLPRGEEIYYPESDSSLESLRIIGFKINFDKNILEYKIHLTSDQSSIKIEAVPTYSDAEIIISNTDNLKNRDIVTIDVKSADESKLTTYKINIIKDAPKKDYRPVLFVVFLSIAFIGTIILFIKTSQKKKASDPLLSLKKNKRRINKGKKFNSDNVPTSDNSTDVSSNAQQMSKENDYEVLDDGLLQMNQGENQQNVVQTEMQTNNRNDDSNTNQGNS